jgi:hypothetical protein
MTLDDRTVDDRNVDDTDYDWREATNRLVHKLDRAHDAVAELGSALDKGDDAAARQTVQFAHEAVDSVAHAVKTMRSELPPDTALDEPDVVGSTLALGGSGVATIALDVMVNAMMALASTDENDDRDDTDFLIGACVDAESAYEVSTAVMQAAPMREGRAILDLRKAYETEGGLALRKRLIDARPRVREIHERVRRVA